MLYPSWRWRKKSQAVKLGFLEGCGGLASIEGCLETPMNTRFFVYKIDFAHPFVPPVYLWYPSWRIPLLSCRKNFENGGKSNLTRQFQATKFQTFDAQSLQSFIASCIEACHPFQIPPQPNPTHPVQSLFDDGSPCQPSHTNLPNRWACGRPPLLFEMYWAGVYINFENGCEGSF